MDEPNAQQVRYWNEEVGPTWVEHEARFDRLVAAPGEAALERAAPRAGESAIDVGCGCGATALLLAQRVRPAGRVLGIDLSAPMLARARERVAASGLENVRLEQADAQTFAFAPASADLVYSRFGVMFFADPVAAFANLRRALRPGGRLVFVCWRSLADNPWVSEPMAVLAPHLPMPPAEDPHAPGPFAFADAERVRAILERAGLRAIRVEAVDLPLVIPGDTPREAAEFLLQLGPTGRAVREARIEDKQPLARALEAALRPHATSAGVRMGAGVWIATAGA
jgi:SAM-dependent methyltransferase